MADVAPTPLETLGADLRQDCWTLAAEVVEEGLHDPALSSLARLAPAAQLGDTATFIAELGRELARPEPNHLRVNGPLAVVVHGHARAREQLGFDPRAVVTEFMVMRRVLQRYVSLRDGLAGDELVRVEERLDDAIDRLAVECIGAYFDSVLAESFPDMLVREVERARRYERGLVVLLLAVDGLGPEGDRILRRLASTARSMLRGSDVAGRLGADAFGVILLESDKHSAGRFLRRLEAELARLRADGEVPESFAYSTGAAHYPSEADDAGSLIAFAEARQGDARRAR